MIHGQAAHLLGRHVADGAEDDSGLRRRRHGGERAPDEYAG
jgi:hypothetical protein